MAGLIKQVRSIPEKNLSLLVLIPAQVESFKKRNFRYKTSTNCKKISILN